MRCDRVQHTISAAMDGPVPRTEAAGAERHAARCAECTAFRDAAQRVRSNVRVRVADEVPDLVDRIMAAVVEQTSDAAGRSIHAPTRRRRGSAMRWVAAATVGVLAGSLLVGGPWPGGGSLALATVVQRALAAAPSVGSFDATYAIIERGLHPSVPERSLSMRIAFLAPQRFRLEVADATRYPSGDWTPTDITYVEDMPSSYLDGPTGCPADLGGDVCPPTRVSISRSSAWSAAAPLPQDLIVPIATLGAGGGIRVIGETSLDGREVVHLRMPFDRAAPLFPFLRLGGTWRPYFSGDVVDVWLDTSAWFPVAITVTPSSRDARAGWELRYGRAPEPADRPILEVRMTGLAPASPPADLFTIPSFSKWTAAGGGSVRDVLGFAPTLPADTNGLELVSATGPPRDEPSTRAVVVYGRGLDYVRIVEDRGWDGPGVFGPFGDLASWTEVAGVGPVLYEPATTDIGRRVAVHTGTTDLFVESNLPRDALFSIVASLPVTTELRADWLRTDAGGITIERLPASAVLAAAGLTVTGLGALPGGYVVSGGQIERDGGEVSSVTLILRQTQSDLAGPPLLLRSMAPARVTPSRGTAVDLGPVAGLLTDAGTRLEWQDGGWLRVLQGAPGTTTLPEIASTLVGAS